MSMREVFYDTIRSLGGWRGLVALTVLAYVFVVVVHLIIPRRHDYATTLKQAQSRKATNSGSSDYNSSSKRKTSSKVQ